MFHLIKKGMEQFHFYKVEIKRRKKMTEMKSVNSSAISKIGYNPGNRLLIIQFHNGRTYDIPGVPEHIYQSLMNAPSKGSYFNSHIKGRY